jgi:hypothetical protein
MIVILYLAMSLSVSPEQERVMQEEDIMAVAAFKTTICRHV